MKKGAVVLLSLFLAGSAAAQVLSFGRQAEDEAKVLDPLRYVSGTTPQGGSVPLWKLKSDGEWVGFAGFSAHVTYASETGPEDQRNETFSTNWLVLGLEREFGDRGFFLVRARTSAEPWTIGDEGYPQMLQYLPDSNPPLVDRMRPRSFVGEAAVHAGWRPRESMLLHLYAAPIGDPALGTAPDGLRASSAEFAEAPYAWDIQESFHSATSVVTAGFAMRWFAIEGSVFRDASVTEDYSSVDFDGDIDSKSARVMFTPTANWSMQVSRGELREEINQRTVSSASVSWTGGPAAVSALWTQREFEQIRETETAYGFEILMRANRHSFMGRAEWVDRPSNFPDGPFTGPLEQTTHFVAGYLYDYVTRPTFRSGFGVNIDYHTQSHELPARYGHKPQTIYAFMRFRS